MKVQSCDELMSATPQDSDSVCVYEKTYVTTK